MPVDLKGLLPHYYVGCVEMGAFQDAFEPEIQLLWERYESLLRQLIVETADADYGLLLWEEMLGIPTDASKDLEFRKTRIRSKLRGQGTTTAAMIKNAVDSFTNGKVEVLEEPERYHFVIRFNGDKGVPSNMDDVSAAVEELKPAHLGYSFEYAYYLIREIHAKKTIRELETEKLYQFAGGR